MAGDIPDIVIGRLPIYLRALTHLAAEGESTTTSSYDLGRKLGISSAQIRKDLSHFGEFGKQGTGYNIKYLIEQLRQILHLDREWAIVLVGAGYIGHALAHYQGFQHRGFQIMWVFDNDPGKIGQDMNGMRIRNMADIGELVRSEGVKVAILAVPASSAQDTTDLLVESGIKSILSYAPINLTVPSDVYVRYTDPVVQLQRMTYYLDS